MSSRKIHTTIILDELVMNKLDEQSSSERRSRSFMVETILREYFKLPWVGERKGAENVNKA